MTEMLKAIEVNCETGEVIERLLTAEEIAQNERYAAEHAVRQAEEEAADLAAIEAKASAEAKAKRTHPQHHRHRDNSTPQRPQRPHIDRKNAKQKQL